MSTATGETPLIVASLNQHTATILLLHGGGETTHVWQDAIDHWQKKQELEGVKFIAPQAPMRNMSISNSNGTAWFDIKSMPSLNPASDEDSAGILESSTRLSALIQNEISAGIPPEKIAIAGFSQGGAIGVFIGLTIPVKIAGVFALSPWLLLNRTFKDYVSKEDVNKQTPVVMGFKEEDHPMRKSLVQDSGNKLEELGYNVTLKSYGGKDHAISTEEVDAAGKFFIEVLSSNKTSE